MKRAALFFFLLFAVLSCISSSFAQRVIHYPETLLPNNSVIHASKQNGYEWEIAIIGGFSIFYSYTGPYIMQFAADEINSNPDLIPGVKLKFRYCETNNSDTNAVLATLYEILNSNVRGIAGGFTSAESMAVQLIAKTFIVPQVSARANTESLNDKTNYPYFARMTFSDYMQGDAILKLFSNYGWTRAIVIFTNEEYGITGNSYLLNSNLQLFSVRVSIEPNANLTDSLAQIDKIVKEQGIRVFVYYMLPPNFIALARVMNATYASSEYAYVMTSPVASNFMETPERFVSFVGNFDGAILVSGSVGIGSVYESTKVKWNALNRTEYPGLRPDPLSLWNWYDAIYVFAHALHSLMDTLGATTNISVLDNITGPQYFNAIKKVDFWGTTGHIIFDQKTNLVANVGVWNLRGGKIVPLGTYYSNSSSLELSDSPLFFGGRTDIPSDSYILPIRRRPDSIKISMGVLTAISGVITVTVAGFLFAKPAAFAKSGRFYCGIIILGAILALVAAAVAIPDPTDRLCIAYPWFLGIGFMLVYGCLFLRTWALFEVFRAAEKMKKINLKPALIMRILALFILCETVLLVVWSAVDPPQRELVTVNNEYRQYRCSAGNLAFWGVFVGYKGIWMLFGAIISFLVRKVREDYNQSAGLGMSVYNCFSITVIAVAIGFILDDNPNVVIVVQVLAILLAFVTTLILLFSRPIYRVILNKPIDTVEPGSKASTGGSGGSAGSARSISSFSAKSREVELA